MRVACMDTVNLCGGVMYKGFYYISLIKAGLYLRVTFIFWILQITLQKKKLICFSVGKWQVGAAVYWNMHTYMCQYCGIGLKPLLKYKIGHVFFQFFPPSCPNSLLHFPDGIASFLTRSSTPLTKMQHKPHQSFRHVLQMAVVTVARFSWPLLHIFRIWSIQYNFI